MKSKKPTIGKSIPEDNREALIEAAKEREILLATFRRGQLRNNILYGFVVLLVIFSALVVQRQSEFADENLKRDAAIARSDIATKDDFKGCIQSQQTVIGFNETFANSIREHLIIDERDERSAKDKSFPGRSEENRKNANLLRKLRVGLKDFPVRDCRNPDTGEIVKPPKTKGG